MRKTAIFKDDLFLKHDPGYDHVESSERLSVIYEQLADRKINESFLFPSCVPASREMLEYNHTKAHVDRIAATAGKTFDMLDPDTMTSPHSHEAACLAAGAVTEGVRMLATGEIENCFALVRPPGHHAEAKRAMGFCLFNNVAIGAHYALQQMKMNRVLIVDWDLHHGNGTQHAFYDTDAVLYFSTHQYPHYPGTGSVSETGAGRGKGFTVNVPLPGGQNDQAYAGIFNKILKPVARQYRPELIMVSAGFDIYHADPLGGMGVTVDGFAYLTRVMLDLAEELCNGRLLLTLEGGYNLQGLRDGVLASLREMSGTGHLNAKTAALLENSTPPAAVFEQVKKIAKPYWEL